MIEAVGTLPNSIYEDTITLLTKPKIIHKRKLQSNSSWDHRFKTLHRKVISNHTWLKSLQTGTVTIIERYTYRYNSGILEVTTGCLIGH